MDKFYIITLLIKSDITKLIGKEIFGLYSSETAADLAISQYEQQLQQGLKEGVDYEIEPYEVNKSAYLIDKTLETQLLRVYDPKFYKSGPELKTFMCRISKLIGLFDQPHKITEESFPEIDFSKQICWTVMNPFGDYMSIWSKERVIDFKSGNIVNDGLVSFGVFFTKEDLYKELCSLLDIN